MSEFPRASPLRCRRHKSNLKVPATRRYERFFNTFEKTYAFFRRNSSDKAQSQNIILDRPLARMEQVRVNTARHQERWPVELLFEPDDLLGVGASVTRACP